MVAKFPDVGGIAGQPKLTDIHTPERRPQALTILLDGPVGLQ